MHSDEHVIVVDKPPGIAVHPGAGRSIDTLVDALLEIFPEIAEIEETERPGIVHRLDIDTSGLMVVARTALAAEHLSREIKSRSVERRYTALVKGGPHPQLGIIDAPIGRDPRNRRRQAVASDGRAARTRYRVIETITRGSKDTLSLLEIKLETGRTHQIRVHMYAIGHPIMGDRTYGRDNSMEGLKRQFLHAHQIAFSHPVTSERHIYRSDLPHDLAIALDTRRK